MPAKTKPQKYHTKYHTISPNVIKTKIWRSKSVMSIKMSNFAPQYVLLGK